MKLKELSARVGQEIKDRANPKTTGSKWAKVRNVCGIAASVGFLLVSPVCPFALAPAAVSWITFGSSVLGIIGGVAHFDKSRK